MPITYANISKRFDIYMANYIQINGDQPMIQIKQLAKQFAIDSRNGVYDICARKRYECIFRTYSFKYNIQLPDDWLALNHSAYDPDNEFPNNLDVIRGKRREEKKEYAMICEINRVEELPE